MKRDFSCWRIRSAEAKPSQTRNTGPDMILKQRRAATGTPAKPYLRAAELSSPHQNSASSIELQMN